MPAKDQKPAHFSLRGSMICCRDFETVTKDNARAVSEMKTLADSFEREVSSLPSMAIHGSFATIAEDNVVILNIGKLLLASLLMGYLAPKHNCTIRIRPFGIRCIFGRIFGLLKVGAPYGLTFGDDVITRATTWTSPFSVFSSN